MRSRVLKLYADIESGKVALTRKLARVLFMTHEHDAFHAEVYSILPYWEMRAEMAN